MKRHGKAFALNLPRLTFSPKPIISVILASQAQMIQAVESEIDERSVLSPSRKWKVIDELQPIRPGSGHHSLLLGRDEHLSS